MEQVIYVERGEGGGSGGGGEEGGGGRGRGREERKGGRVMEGLWWKKTLDNFQKCLLKG